MSIPAETPADVTTPSSTTRRPGCTLTVGSRRVKRSSDPQCVVARRFLSRLARASTSAPVHTEVTRRAAAATRATHSSVSASSSSARVPNPPGTTSRSIGGALSKS